MAIQIIREGMCYEKNKVKKKKIPAQMGTENEMDQGVPGGYKSFDHCCKYVNFKWHR